MVTRVENIVKETEQSMFSKEKNSIFSLFPNYTFKTYYRMKLYKSRKEKLTVNLKISPVNIFDILVVFFQFFFLDTFFHNLSAIKMFIFISNSKISVLTKILKTIRVLLSKT